MENDSYFLTVLRYIHRNPVKAGIAPSPAQYPFSSYASYLRDETDGLTDTGALLALVPKGEFAAWQEQDDKADCLDAAWRTGRISISDEKALRVMRKASGSENLETFLHLPDKRRVGTIQRMRRAGASLNQIVRLTGTSMATVRKAVK